MKKSVNLLFILCLMGILILSCNRETELVKAEMMTLVSEEGTLSLKPDTLILDFTLKTPAAKTVGELCEEESLKCFLTKSLTLVKLSGRINHFGYDITQTPPVPFDYFENVPYVKVWIAEYPFTRLLNITSGADGIWTIYVLKPISCDLDFSYIYEKEGWVTTKSNVIPVMNEDNTDIAIHFIDPLYFYYGVKPQVESILSAMLGFPFVMENGLVTTIGKSWATLHEEILPHGDPGAIALMTPAASFPPTIGPVYFNEQVEPDPLATATSFDGGVMWFNIQAGTFEITGQKPGVLYNTIRFVITPEDIANGVILFIGSPPDSVIGDNDSGPGQW